VVSPGKVIVRDFNGQAGDSFEVFFHEQKAGQILPQTKPPPGDPRAGEELYGCPEAGLTNAQAKAKHNVCWSGHIAPASATTHARVVGLVAPLGG
jgi:hypothetical protein